MGSLRSLLGLCGTLVLTGTVAGCIVEASDGDSAAGGNGLGGASAVEGGGGEGPVIPEPEAGMALLRVIHGAGDAPTIDVWANGKPLFTNLSFGGASTWQNVPPGTYDIEIKASPSTAESAAVYAVNGLALEEGEKVSAVAAGLLASSADADKFRVLPIREAFAPAGSNNAILRVVHASPDAPTVGIDLHNDDPSAPELSNIDRFTATDGAGFPLTAGKALQVGIAAFGQRVTAFTTPELPVGAEILVLATGLVAERADEPQGLSLLAIGPVGAIGFIKQNPIVYALHASPNAPSIDIYAGEAALRSDLSFGNLAGPIQVPPNDYQIDVRPAFADPASAPAVSAKTGALLAGGRYLSVATGFLGGSGEQAFRFVTVAEQFGDGTAENALVRVVHGAPDAPMVDLGVLNVEGVVNPVLFPDLSFGSATAPAGLDVGIGQVPIGVTPASENSTVVASFHLLTEKAMRAFAIAAGALSPEKGAGFRLLVVDTQSAPWSVTTVHPQPQ